MNRTGDVASGGSWGIYKFGQGYWVRVLTAILAGTLILMGGVWTWSRLAAVSIPVTGYSLALTQVTGSANSGGSVDLYKGQEKIGTAQLESFNLLEDKKSAAAKVTSLDLVKGRIAADVDHLRTGELAAPTFVATVATRDARYLFPRLYLQGGVSIAFLVIGCFFLYRFVASSPTTVDFLVATDSEMKKVNWSTRKHIQDSTAVVIGATFLIAALIFASDFGVSKLMEIIGVLQR